MAAREFARQAINGRSSHIKVELFGSLSKTGRGHGTDIAVVMGLQGYDPTTISPESLEESIQAVRQEGRLRIDDRYIPFSWPEDIHFADHTLPEHPNAMTFTVKELDGTVHSQTFYSVGGGFIEMAGQASAARQVTLPYPIDHASDLLGHLSSAHARICDIVYQNELAFQSGDEVDDQISQIYHAMLDSVYRGCHTEGVLPGGLNVRRRAKKMSDQLLHHKRHFDVTGWLVDVGRSAKTDFSLVTRWVNCFALAVNEENAAFGRIVTSPTNGASGVIPAVLLYHLCFGQAPGPRDIRDFLLTAGEVGCLFKKGATISAAVGGCQAEIGVSSAMAAAGLTEVMGGSPEQALMAAEIAMEHHLGLTCDPIGGLVQIPCIERNAMGAMKAITAANLALQGNPQDAIVKFDTIVETMWSTAQDMHHHYKETAEGGLAFHLSVIQPSC